MIENKYVKQKDKKNGGGNSVPRAPMKKTSKTYVIRVSEWVSGLWVDGWVIECLC